MGTDVSMLFSPFFYCLIGKAHGHGLGYAGGDEQCIRIVTVKLRACLIVHDKQPLPVDIFPIHIDNPCKCDQGQDKAGRDMPAGKGAFQAEKGVFQAETGAEDSGSNIIYQYMIS